MTDQAVWKQRVLPEIMSGTGKYKLRQLLEMHGEGRISDQKMKEALLYIQPKDMEKVTSLGQAVTIMSELIAENNAPVFWEMERQNPGTIAPRLKTQIQGLIDIMRSSPSSPISSSNNYDIS